MLRMMRHPPPSILDFCTLTSDIFFSAFMSQTKMQTYGIPSCYTRKREKNICRNRSKGICRSETSILVNRIQTTLQKFGAPQTWPRNAMCDCLGPTNLSSSSDFKDPSFYSVGGTKL
jgi:hypothetical protein